ncbi:IS1182 family transposase [Porphyromonas loveana]|uniref:IS1182 family transposase n=1 Tax=Porphyromonas loveana TaxID=1884669 RepID=UPI00359FB443
MAKVVFKSYNPNDSLLLPPCLGDYLPQNHPVRVVSAIIDRLDLSEIESDYKGGGASSYNPKMLLKVIVYAYLNNVYSGRQMEKLLIENIAYMWLSGMQTPDFRTINIFRSKRLANKFDKIFTQIVLLLNEEGLVSLKVQYIDGTKIESVANKYTFVWKGSTEKNKAKLEANVKAVLESAEQALAMETAEEQQELTSEEMARRADRILEKMDKEGISDKELRKAVNKVKTESAAKQKEYEDKLETLGDRNSYSKTDPDATFMRMKEDAMNNGQTKPGYNVQISTENQFITNYGIFWRPNDQGTMIPYLKSFESRFGMQSEEVCADSGYGSEQNYAHMISEGITPYVKYNMFHVEDHRKYKNNPFLPRNMYFNAADNYYVCPMGRHLKHIYDTKSKSDLGYVSVISVYRSVSCEGCPLRGMCYKGKAPYREIDVNHQADEYKAYAKGLLTSERGLYHRSSRPVEPEAVFGDIKFNHGFKRFRLKSNVKVNVEFGLVALAHNLRKYIAIERMRSNAVGSCL